MTDLNASVLGLVQTEDAFPVRPEGAATVMWMTWDDPAAFMGESDLWVKTARPDAVTPGPAEPKAEVPVRVRFVDEFNREDGPLNTSQDWADVLTGKDGQGITAIGNQAGPLTAQAFQVVRLMTDLGADHAIQVRIIDTAKKMSENHGVTLCVRMQEDAADGYLPNCYYLTVTATEWVFKKRVGSVSELMTDGVRPHAFTFPALVRLEAKGDTFEAFINGQRLFTLSDEVWATGSVGFGLKAAPAEGPASVRVDDLRAETL